MPASAAWMYSWLTSLQLVAVQPACLKSHTDTPILHHDQQLGQVAAEQAGAPQQQQQPGQQQSLHQQQQTAADLQHHELLLQLQATLTTQHQSVQRDASVQGPHLQVSSVAAGANMANCQLLPIPVHKAVLQVVLLNRQMQVLLHKQYSFQQLLQEQQQQHQLGAASSSSAPTVFTTAAAAAGSSQGVSSCLSSSQHTDQVLHLNIQLSAPSQPSAYTLDALHLFVTLCSAQLADPAEDDSEGQQQQACLVAELPLLVMPAPAQQEVQQLLLPAMRQDVQSEQLQQQEHMGPAAIAQQSLQVEQAVWQHFNQLALDILLIMQLSEAVRAEAAHATDAAMSVAVDSSQPMSPSAASSVPATEELLQQHGQHSEVQHGMPPALGASSAMDNLLQAVNTLLLPLLLPFLTAHGLHSTLQVLLQCLPPQLQLQQHWQQQQLVRLHALTAQVQPPPPPLAQHDAAGMDPGGAAALPALGDMVVVSSTRLDTPLARPVVAASTSAPAAAERACPSRSASSVYESFGSGGLSATASSCEQQVPGSLLQQGASSSGVQVSTEQPGSSGTAQQQEQQQAVAAATSSAGASTRGAGAGAGAGGGLRRRGVAAARVAGRSPSGDHPDEGRGGSDDDSVGSGRSSSGSTGAAEAQGVSAYQFGVLTEATGMPCWLVPFRQFEDSDVERRCVLGFLSTFLGLAVGYVPLGHVPHSCTAMQSNQLAAWRCRRIFSREHSAYSCTGLRCAAALLSRRYVAYKHHQLLFLDMLGGLYQLAVAASLTKRSLFDHPATWILLLMTLIKALPHVPLLLGYRQKHIRYVVRLEMVWFAVASSTSIAVHSQHQTIRLTESAMVLVMLCICSPGMCTPETHACM